MRAGIVGCGAVVQKNYLSVLPSLPFLTVTDVYDVNGSSAQRIAEIINARVSTLAEIKANTDVVIIATPPQTHYQLVKEFLLANKNVICEKPFVEKKELAQELFDLSQEKNVNLFVAHFRRCFPQLQLARSIILSGILGNVKAFSAIEGGRFTWESKSGYTATDPFGGVLFDTGSHTLDMVLYASGFDFGEIEFFIRTQERDKHEPSNEMKARLTFQTANSNGTAFIYFSRYQALANMIRITCENGSLECSVGLSNQILLRGSNGVSVVYTRENVSNLMDCFGRQFFEMFYYKNDAFSVKNFINLSSLLEKLSQ